MTNILEGVMKSGTGSRLSLSLEAGGIAVYILG